jgi:hypothetical protein
METYIDKLVCANCSKYVDTSSTECWGWYSGYFYDGHSVQLCPTCQKDII